MVERRLCGPWLRSLALLAVFAAGGCSNFPLTIDPAEADVYTRAKQHYTEADYAGAVEQFQLALARDPGSIEALNGLAAAYDQLGRFDLADRSYRRALAIDPQSAQTLNNLGVSHLLRGKPDLATVFLDEARRADGESAEIAANRNAAVAMVRAETAPAKETTALPAPEPKPIRRMTAVVQKLYTRAPTASVKAAPPVEARRRVPEAGGPTAVGEAAEPDMAALEAGSLMIDVPWDSGVKGAESPSPYSSLTIRIGELSDA